MGFVWTPESEDCDDFARFAAAYAGLLHVRSKVPTGLAFGEFAYLRSAFNGGGGHAINAFVTREDGKLALNFFEPQNGQPLNLTPGEIESCVYCKF